MYTANGKAYYRFLKSKCYGNKKRKKLTSVDKSGRLHGSNVLYKNSLSIGSDKRSRIFIHHKKCPLEQWYVGEGHVIW